MAFRNPARWLPADRITGQISGSQLKADAIDGKVITGATVQTAASGRRIVLAPDGNTYWYTGTAGEFAPARIQTEAGANPSLSLFGPLMDSGTEDYGLKLTLSGVDTSALINTNTTTVVGDMNVAGNFKAGNIAWGSVQITPVPDTDTSVTVTGVNLNNLGTYRVFLTVNSAFPSVLKAPTATGASADGFTLYINRSTNASTNVWWLMVAK